MIINKNTTIIGERIILVPYYAKHVLKYHGWMKCPVLREETGSEELSIDEEYSMCSSWRYDEDKITFIILSKAKYNNKNDEIDSMIGDINGFIYPEGIELSVMIADKEFRKKGCASEALRLMIKYCQINLNNTNFFAVINDDNIQSIQLFKNLGFTVTEEIKAFKQLKLSCDNVRIKENLQIDYYND
uniref:N-acetyltransferase domain-containing protein n=1 Tax=Parastrongyloides trichosuri TaxID=131310 RepID=A0A0N4ZH12_PARTI